MSARKSYWQRVSVRSDRDKTAIASWFNGIADGMTPYKAEVLCDIQTDREKKIRAFMVDAKGKHYQLVRTRGGKTFSVSIKPIQQGDVNND